VIACTVSFSSICGMKRSSMSDKLVL
jgi:hypothetical protein